MLIYNDIEKGFNDISELAKSKKQFLVAINFEINQIIIVLNPLKQKYVLFRTPLHTNIRPIKQNNIILNSQNVSYDDYLKGFRIIQQGLLRGDSYLANYTLKTPIICNLSLEAMAQCSSSPYCLMIPKHFVSFSPECFVKICGEEIATHPMKGTIDANIPNAKAEILKDKKEIAEHNTVVDLLRNDLGIVSNKVIVKQFRYITAIHSIKGDLLQVSSEIVGYIGNKWQERLGSILKNILPAGSICGAPKLSTIKLIQKAEKHTRNFYSGIFGYFDGANFDSAVLIRFIEQDKKENLFFHSGGGITINSNPIMEYNEILQKIYIPT
ncbi:MAG: aminodeoxychorismate synthase component I [Bacteroidales bacterium]